MSIPKLDLPVRRLDAQQLRAAVRGEDRRISRKTALYLLAQRTDLENRELDFQAVLESARESRSLRYFAAMYLGKLDTVRSRAILEQNLRLDDELVLGGVMRSLAGIGDAESLRRIGEISADLRGWVADEAAWAERLLAHRHEVPGYEVRMPVEGEYLHLGERRSRELDIREATEHERATLARSLELEPVGMSVARDHVYRLQCGSRTMLLLLNRRLAQGPSIREAVGSCALAAVIVHWHHGEQVYAPIYFVMTCPDPGTTRVGVTFWNANGRLVFAAAAVVADGAVRFSIRGVAGFGGLPVDIAGALAHGGIDLRRRTVGIGVSERRAAARSAVPEVAGVDTGRPEHR